MTAITAILLATSFAPPTPTPFDLIREKGLNELGAYSLLAELSDGIGPRLSGSENAAKAVEWGRTLFQDRLKFNNVRLVPCMVPHWVRGDKEYATAATLKTMMPLTCCALGGSVGTGPDGVSGEVIEVKSLEEAGKLGERAKGKIVFYNGPMNPQFVTTFQAYGAAVGQRFAGASVAAGQGAVAVLVRSMTLAIDDYPHTGAMGYDPKFPRIPAAALSTVAAYNLSEALKQGPVSVQLRLSCETLPDAPSANVIAEVVGSEKPNEVIVIGGHLDSWDKGRGAHDDGAGVTQSIEALRLIKESGLRPKRTIRVVLFMNEENGGRGARAYFEMAKASGQKHIAALESDAGGFAPRGFGVSLKPNQMRKLDGVRDALKFLQAGELVSGGEGGADVGPLGAIGAVLFGLTPESQRYFDYHHSDKDTLDKVNPRELELGAIGMATLAWFISEKGL